MYMYLEFKDVSLFLGHGIKVNWWAQNRIKKHDAKGRRVPMVMFSELNKLLHSLTF